MYYIILVQFLTVVTFVLHYIYIVSLTSVSNLMMAKSEMAETCCWSWYLRYTCKYSCVM